MTEWKARVLPLFTQVLLALMAIALLYLGVSFARQVSVSLQRQHEIEDLEGRIGATLEERANLEQSLQLTLSDTAVEKWAWAHGWARADQVIVVPVGGPAGSSAEEQMVPQQSTTPSSPQEAWWDRFFGSR